jgi:perosamine synthetase
MPYLSGSETVFADIDKKTFALDPDDVIAKITSKTKAIIGVHLFGHPFNVKGIKRSAKITISS